MLAPIYVSSVRPSSTTERSLLRAAGYRRRAVLVGTGPQIEAVAHALGGGSDPPLDPVGFVSLTPRPENGLKDLGPLEQLERHFDAIDEVLIADPAFPQEQAVDLVDRCHRHGVRVRVAPSTMEILMDRVEFIPGQTLRCSVAACRSSRASISAIKRTFDMIVAWAGVVALAPAMLVLALMI